MAGTVAAFVGLFIVANFKRGGGDVPEAPAPPSSTASTTSSTTGGYKWPSQYESWNSESKNMYWDQE
eukprot:g16612.t1